MSRVFTEEGNHVAVTVLRVDNCQVIAQRTPDRDGYTALQLGVGAAKVKNVTKPQRGHFAAAKVEPKAKLAEFRVSEDALVAVGSRDHRGAFRARAIRRRDRNQHRQGLCRRHEAAQFRRPARQPRRVGLASQPGLDRAAAGPRQDLQEQEDGRPARQRAGHDAEPRNRRIRRRARSHSDQGLGAGQRKRLGADPRCRKAQGAGRAAVPGRAAQRGTADDDEASGDAAPAEESATERGAETVGAPSEEASP